MTLLKISMGLCLYAAFLLILQGKRILPEKVILSRMDWPFIMFESYRGIIYK